MDSGSSRTAWYSNMSCNQCRRRVGLRPHDELAKNKSIEFHEANMAHAVRWQSGHGRSKCAPLATLQSRRAAKGHPPLRGWSGRVGGACVEAMSDRAAVFCHRIPRARRRARRRNDRQTTLCSHSPGTCTAALATSRDMTSATTPSSSGGRCAARQPPECSRAQTACADSEAPWIDLLNPPPLALQDKPFKPSSSGAAVILST